MNKSAALCLMLLLTACTAPAPTPLATPTTVPTARPVTSPAATARPVPVQNAVEASGAKAVTASPTLVSTVNVSPAPANVEIVADAALKQDLIAELSRQVPDTRELAQASLLAEEHARQLANNPQDSEFKLKAVYDPIPPGALSTRLLQEGIYSTDNLVNAYLADGSPEAIRTKFSAQLKSILGPVPFSDYGLSVVRKGGGWYVSLILLTRIITLDNLPLTVPATGIRHISGQLLLPGYSQPKILMTRADGEVESVETRTSGTAFEADVPLAQTGLYSFEVNVNGPLGPLPASNFIVAVGTAYPSPQPVETQSETLGDLGVARSRLLELVNRDRQAQGLGVLKADATLDQAAQSHSDDMVKNGFIGHNSPTAGTPQQQAAAFGVTDLISQNLAVSRSINNSERELMSSPGHRKTILEPNHTHVGFGVTTGSDGFLYITQVFVRRVLTVAALPAQAQLGQTLRVRGSASAAGHVGVFIDNQLQGDYVTVKAGEAFDLPVTLNQAGKVRLLIGYAEPGGQTLNFNFYNIWDLTVS